MCRPKDVKRLCAGHIKYIGATLPCLEVCDCLIAHSFLASLILYLLAHHILYFLIFVLDRTYDHVHLVAFPSFAVISHTCS